MFKLLDYNVVVRRFVCGGTGSCRVLLVSPCKDLTDVNLLGGVEKFLT